jgi:hypothetical protein
MSYDILNGIHNLNRTGILEYADTALQVCQNHLKSMDKLCLKSATLKQLLALKYATIFFR